MDGGFQRQLALIDAIQAVAAVRIRSELHIYTSSISRGPAHFRDLGSLINCPSACTQSAWSWA